MDVDDLYADIAGFDASVNDTEDFNAIPPPQLPSNPPQTTQQDRQQEPQQLAATQPTVQIKVLDEGGDDGSGSNQAEWQDVVNAAIAATHGGLQDTSPTAVAAVIQQLAGDLQDSRRAEAAMQVQLAEKHLECIELRRALQAAVHRGEPNIIQCKQLLLDPVVNKEFLRLKSELDDAREQLRTAKDEMQGLQFSKESNDGKRLMARVKELMQENVELGKQLQEGNVQMLTYQLDVAKSMAEKLRQNYLALEDHCAALDAEAEELHQEVFKLRRQQSEAEANTNARSDHSRSQHRGYNYSGDRDRDRDRDFDDRNDRKRPGNDKDTRYMSPPQRKHRY